MQRDDLIRIRHMLDAAKETMSFAKIGIEFIIKEETSCERIRPNNC